MVTVLRQYDPEGCLCGCGGECDESGVPLDWERCRRCRGTGEPQTPAGVPLGQDRKHLVCGQCGGHGSLKAAALAHCAERQHG